MERGRMSEFGDHVTPGPMKRLEVPAGIATGDPDVYWPDGCRDFTDVMIRHHFEQVNAYGREQGAREILRLRDPGGH